MFCFNSQTLRQTQIHSLTQTQTCPCNYLVLEPASFRLPFGSPPRCPTSKDGLRATTAVADIPVGTPIMHGPTTAVAERQ